jgi:hypothetical protein
MSLQQSLEQFVAPYYGKTQRTTDTFKAVAVYCSDRLVQLTAQYHLVDHNQQTRREVRNDIDYHLRRYHEYCIKQRKGVGAHYHEVAAESVTDFEHLIPAARIRDLLLAGTISVVQALNAPTVKLSRSKHVLLKKAGLGATTPNMWLPFARYSQVFDATFVTNDGTVVDPAVWTLDHHFSYFQHLVIQS